MTSPDTATRVGLRNLIDYAGMYPPESLSLDVALSTYRRHAKGARQWMLGVFLCPSSQLHDLEWMLDGELLPVGVVVDQPMTEAIEAISVSGLVIHQIETRDITIAGHFDALAPSHAIWLEADPKSVFDIATQVPGRRIGCKVRCGGSRPNDFPSSSALADTMELAFAAGLPLKATAGLHHPWRHYWPERGVWRHGFLNLLAAAAELSTNGHTDRIVGLLEATEGRLTPLHLRVGKSEFGPAALGTARIFLRSYGSCSFDEPVEDLEALGAI